MLTVILAALLGVVGIVAVLAYVHRSNDSISQGLNPETVLVASGPIPEGTSVSQAISGNLLVPRQFPKSALPQGVITGSITHRLSKMVTTSALQPGMILLTSMLAHRGQLNGNIALPSGQMAIAVEVCLDAAVAGYLQPGAKVVLFDTYMTGTGSLQSSCDSSHQSQDIKNVKARVVLPKVEVLAVSTSAPTGADVAQTSGLSTSGTASQGALYVTLAVSQSQAEQVMLASTAGLPYFTLLAPDATGEPDPGSTLFSPKS
jgi:pilus assembly protein CpaB